MGRLAAVLADLAAVARLVFEIRGCAGTRRGRDAAPAPDRAPDRAGPDEQEPPPVAGGPPTPGPAR